MGRVSISDLSLLFDHLHIYCQCSHNLLQILERCCCCCSCCYLLLSNHLNHCSLKEMVLAGLDNCGLVIRLGSAKLNSFVPFRHNYCFFAIHVAHVIVVSEDTDLLLLKEHFYCINTFGSLQAWL